MRFGVLHSVGSIFAWKKDFNFAAKFVTNSRPCQFWVPKLKSWLVWDLLFCYCFGVRKLCNLHSKIFSSRRRNRLLIRRGRNLIKSCAMGKRVGRTVKICIWLWFENNLINTASFQPIKPNESNLKKWTLNWNNNLPIYVRKSKKSMMKN